MQLAIPGRATRRDGVRCLQSKGEKRGTRAGHCCQTSSHHAKAHRTSPDAITQNTVSRACSFDAEAEWTGLTAAAECLRFFTPPPATPGIGTGAEALRALSGVPEESVMAPARKRTGDGRRCCPACRIQPPGDGVNRVWWHSNTRCMLCAARKELYHQLRTTNGSIFTSSLLGKRAMSRTLGWVFSSSMMPNQ